MGTREAMQQLAEQLTTAGVPTRLDPRDVNPPGCWLQRVSQADDILAPDCTTLRVRVALIAPDIGAYQALGLLDGMYAAAVTVLDPNVDGTAYDRTFLLPDSSTAYPGTFYDTDVQVTPDPEPEPEPDPEPEE